MSSKLVLGSKPAILIYSTKAKQKSSIRWGRKRDARNICIGQKLSGQRHAGVGIATPGNSKGAAFKTAVAACRGAGR